MSGPDAAVEREGARAQARVSPARKAAQARARAMAEHARREDEITRVLTVLWQAEQEEDAVMDAARARCEEIMRRARARAAGARQRVDAQVVRLADLVGTREEVIERSGLSARRIRRALCTAPTAGDDGGDEVDDGRGGEVSAAARSRQAAAEVTADSDASSGVSSGAAAWGDEADATASGGVGPVGTGVVTAPTPQPGEVAAEQTAGDDAGVDQMARGEAGSAA